MSSWLFGNLFLRECGRQYVVVSCSVVPCGAAWCSVVQRGAVWCSVVQCGAVWCSERSGDSSAMSSWLFSNLFCERVSVVFCGAVGG